MNQFELSRVYAKGWSAGRASGLGSSATAVDAEIDALNPYQAAEEKARWAAGFKDALCRNEETGRSRKRQSGNATRSGKS
jgi:hypothetical protein